MKLKPYIEMFNRGDHCTNSELETLLEAYEKVVKATLPFGETYRLVMTDAALNAANIRISLRNRNRKQSFEA